MVKASDVLLILVAIIFPPAAAAFVTGCSCDLLINICLTILGYFPGHIVRWQPVSLKWTDSDLQFLIIARLLAHLQEDAS
ncbi:hypothetical protein BD769DRAFT_1481172 [Suillus cothurnatus]|nr:hypothetical protein BD769DRAFT_1481172 [Suillus cothurnatus]